jgi:hypothetical protein
MNKQSMTASVLSAGIALIASAQESPFFQASLTPDYAIYDRTERIEGVTLSVWGENPQASLSIGLVNGSTDASSGLSIGILNYAESYTGVQWAFANFTEGDCSGWQGGPVFGLVISVANYTGGSMSGVQAGVVNMAGTLSGLQFGLINYTREADGGVQIGIVNLIEQNKEWFTQLPNELAPGMILANWSF